MSKDMVGQLVAEHEGELVVGRGETGHGSGDEQAFAVRPGVEFVGRIQLDVVAAGACGSPCGLVIPIAAKRQLDRAAGEGQVEPLDVGLDALEGRRLAGDAACQGLAVDAEQQIAPAPGEVVDAVALGGAGGRPGVGLS
jgi:hypothetical protein